MGQQSTLALLAFLLCHISLILSIIAIVTPEWTDTDIITVNGTKSTNVTYNKGLFKICSHLENDGSNCSNLNETLQTTSFKAVQGLYISAVGTIGIAAILYWVLVLSLKLNTARCVAGCIIALEVLTNILATTVLVLYGLTYQNAKDIPSGLEEKLGYSYWVAVVGSALAAFAVGCSCRHLRLINARPVGYMDL